MSVRKNGFSLSGVEDFKYSMKNIVAIIFALVLFSALYCCSAQNDIKTHKTNSMNTIIESPFGGIMTKEVGTIRGTLEVSTERLACEKYD